MNLLAGVSDGVAENIQDQNTNNFDLSTVTDILSNVDPQFVRDTWEASGQCINRFNRRIFNAFSQKSYPTVNGSPPTATDTEPLNNVAITCECCYNEKSVEDTAECNRLLHNFCQSCIVKCTEMTLGRGEFHVKCMTNCDGEISANALKNALPMQLLEKLQTVQQMFEIKEANLEGIEYCPHCHFAYVPIPGDGVFRCLNPKCMQQTCLRCKRASHVSHPCEENPLDVTVRRKIEEAMSDELIRVCFNCSRRFVKVGGCNNMTCVCGASMCYACKQPNGRCLVDCGSEDDIVLHGTHVIQAGRRARDEELQKSPGAILLYDPTE